MNVGCRISSALRGGSGTDHTNNVPTWSEFDQKDEVKRPKVRITRFYQ